MSVFDAVSNLSNEMRKRIIGQGQLVNRLLIALLSDGHLLVEGAPGLAKTRAIKELASLIECDYKRIQFTPDLLPADITGTEIYRPEDASFKFQQGPLFNNMVLADEINRAPAKVQSALLEAMAEQQVSVGHQTYALPRLFMVMATQNPIEQEGTYPLPEAQLDRFMMHVTVAYPEAAREAEILRLVRAEKYRGGSTRASASTMAMQPLLEMDTVFAARTEVLSLHMAENIENYIVRLVTSTRSPASISSEMARWIAYGASPRGTIALDICARANAWLSGRDYVSPDDVQSVIHDVLRHRILLSYEAEADDVTSDKIIDRLLNHVAVP